MGRGEKEGKRMGKEEKEKRKRNGGQKRNGKKWEWRMKERVKEGNGVMKGGNEGTNHVECMKEEKRKNM